jgi:hypothetical protein
MSDAAWQREALRQQMLVGALGRESSFSSLRGWLREDRAGAARQQRGLSAYRANAGACAERALAAAYPTVQQLLGTAGFAALARAMWQAHMPCRGDLAHFGAELPGFIEASAQLVDEPYLADCARLDWAVHQVEAAVDADDVPRGLDLLAQHDPAQLSLQLRPGSALLSSQYPLAALWHAHRSTADERFEPVRAALHSGQGEHALVWRQGWRAQVQALPHADLGFTQALLRQCALSRALDEAGAAFDFTAWLQRALQLGWLSAVLALEP